MNSKSSVFRKGSSTYYFSSFFFPSGVKKQVTTLYVFVRIFDDLVDDVPQNSKQFYKYWKLYNKAWDGPCGVDFIDQMISLAREKKIKKQWIDAFLKSMEMDLAKPKHNSLIETEEYMYGSAEVIGLMMAKIMDLSEEAQTTAKKLGKAMQYANFIRDFREDIGMERDYLQINNREEFIDNISMLVDRYYRWQAEAEKGFKYLPKKYLIPIKTASEMYKWTVAQIASNPEIVFSKKVKPSKFRIIMTGIKLGLSL